MEIRVDGLAEIQKRLSELPKRLETKVVRGALREGANVMKNEAQSLVRVDDKGLLKRSIKVVEGRQTKGRRVGPQVSVIAGDRRIGIYWAHFYEYGTASFYAGKRGRSKRAPYVIKPKAGDLRTVRVLKRNKRGTAIGTDKKVKQTVKMLRIPLGRGRSGPFKFVKSVIHPGIKRRAFMRPALDNKGEEAIRTFAVAVKRRFNEVVG